MTRRAILWATAALAGIVATAALAWFASQLAGQRIGLSSEPLSVTSGLAPAREVTGGRLKTGAQPTRQPRSSHPTHAGSRSQPTTTVYIAPAQAPAASAPVVTPPPSSATSAAPTATPAGSSSTPRQRDDNGGGSGNGSGSSHGGGQRDD